MAYQKFFTAEQLELAKIKLDELPDLAADKITRADMLENLKVSIVTLANDKGYKAAEIKSALADVGVMLSEKSISELIRSEKKSNHVRKKRSPSSPACVKQDAHINEQL